MNAGDLLAAAERRLPEVPLPQSWAEVAICGFLFDRAGRHQLREYLRSSYWPYAQVARRILEDEERQGRAVEVDVKSLFAAASMRRADAQALFERWLPVSLRSFGRPGTEGDRKAVQFGLKGRPAADVIRNYLLDLRNPMADCGLVYPARSRLSLDLDLPEELPLQEART